jgi:virginiamycin A acetyltransferase
VWETLKAIAFALATVAVVPSWLSFKLRSHVLGSDRALEGSTQAWALVPGIPGDYFRRAFLGLVLARCDRTATIGYGTTFSKTRASIAEGVVIGPHCNLGWVNIAHGALIGPGCHLPSGARTHGTSDPAVQMREQGGDLVEVRIGAGAWIGSGAIVMADVGEESVIAAGSVVHEAIPAGVVAGGVPARVLKRRAVRS